MGLLRGWPFNSAGRDPVALSRDEDEDRLSEFSSDLWRKPGLVDDVTQPWARTRAGSRTSASDDSLKSFP